MFHVKEFVRRIDLSPRNIGSNIHELIHKELLHKVEGSCTAAGYIIAVLRVIRIGHGKIQLNGRTTFTANYEALVLRPQTGDIVDAPIISTSKLGFFASVGPLSIFISNYQIPHALLEELGTNIVVRLKIIGMKIDCSKVYAIGTLSDECLGVLG